MNRFSYFFRNFGKNMASRFRHFMLGRYGTDKLNMAILGAGVIACLLGLFTHNPYLDLALTVVSYVLMAWAIFRTLSRNTYKRYQENRKYLRLVEKWKDKEHKDDFTAYSFFDPEEKKGICFDYAALMTAMLRSQEIPCKLVVGYAGNVYHAWISVWTAENGWIDGAIFFDGQVWTRMDPTFASSGGRSEEIMNFINGGNYTTKYLY